MTDYFANAAYGILLDDEKCDEIEAMGKEAGFDLDDENERDRFISWLNAERAGWLFRLRDELKAPKGAALIWTDYEDKHPGCSATPPESWVLGFGICSVLDQDPESLREWVGARWRAWVTS